VGKQQKRTSVSHGRMPGRVDRGGLRVKGLDWDDLKIFTSVARGGSVRAAARELGIHHSTVARRIDHFEQRVGALLFDRTPDGLRLSTHGESVFAQAERVQDGIDGIERVLWGRDRRLAGTIRVTFPDAVGVGFLMTELAGFRAAYPDIALEFIASDDPLNLGRREADIAIRVTREPPAHLVGRPLGTFAVAVYASTAYLASHDPFGAPAGCNWIAWESSRTFGEEVRVGLFPDMPSSTRCANALLQLAAAEAGMGVALLPCALADGRAGLRRIAPDEPIEAQPLWLLTHPDLRNAARVRALMQWIVEAFERRRDLLMGRGAWEKEGPEEKRRRTRLRPQGGPEAPPAPPPSTCSNV
jgi:DNA-binding transcriptional LysR family regulator